MFQAVFIHIVFDQKIKSYLDYENLKIESRRDKNIPFQFSTLHYKEETFHYYEELLKFAEGLK